jgi:methylenetetrahydrofolate reductase (NADPH)
VLTMKVIDIIKQKNSQGRPAFSVELIPPRNGALLSSILKKVDSLAEVTPDFVSITRGAGGSLRGGTVPIAYIIKQRTGIETVAHLTCIDTSIEEIENSLIDHWYLGLENILALRGDPPADAPPEYKEFRGLHYHRYARDLVRQIYNLNQGKYLVRGEDRDSSGNEKMDFRKATPTGFCVAVAGHPEGPPECPDLDVGMEYLREKVEAGAEFIITQMVFSAETFRDFVKKARDAGINIPIIAGVRPVTKRDQIPHIENFFKVKINDSFKQELNGLEEKQEKERGIQLTTELCRDLLEAGASGIHLYVMNDVKTAKNLIGQLIDTPYRSFDRVYKTEDY